MGTSTRQPDHGNRRLPQRSCRSSDHISEHGRKLYGDHGSVFGFFLGSFPTRASRSLAISHCCGMLAMLLTA